MNIDDKAWFAELNIAVETRCRPDLDDIDAANIVTCIESILAENERLKDELAKYRDAPVVVWRTHPFDYGIGHEGVYASTHFKEQSEVWKRKGWRVEELIIKPGE